MLIECTFGRKRPSLGEDMTINFNSLDDGDLKTLVDMVCTEYFKDLSDQVNSAYKSQTTSSKRHHVYDVVLMTSGSYKQGGDLAICRPTSNGTLLMQDKYTNLKPVEESQYDRRVASLSSAARIIESLLSQPDSGSLMHHAMKRDKILDIRKSLKAQLPPSISDGLNSSQQAVVEAVTHKSFKDGFVAVHGPPGTGKTSTIVAILKAIERGAIVTAPSNAAVAHLALALVATNLFSITDLIVWGENCDERVQFLNPVIRSDRYHGFRRAYDDITKSSEKEENCKLLLQNFASWLHLTSDEICLNRIADLCEPDGDGAAGRALPPSVRFVFCTLNTAGSPALRKAGQHKFDVIILDEAGQSPEAEFYIATTFPGVKRVIICGDPRQLPATVRDERCKQAGYGESFLSHILKFSPEKIHLLNTQYRMDPAILQFPNETWYNSEILSDGNVVNREPRVDHPIRVMDMSNMSGEVRDGTSWRNVYEAEAIKSLLCRDEDILRLQENADSVRTIIITPYLAQVKHLKRILKKYRVDIATVDSFQGQEGDIVVVSSVRTKTAAEFLDDYRMNVAVTRAKRVLRIFCAISFCRTLPTKSPLNQLAIFAEKKNLITVAPVDADWVCTISSLHRYSFRLLTQLYSSYLHARPLLPNKGGTRLANSYVTKADDDQSFP